MKAYVFEVALFLLILGIVCTGLAFVTGWLFFLAAQHFSPQGVGVSAGVLVLCACLGIVFRGLRA